MHATRVPLIMAMILAGSAIPLSVASDADAPVVTDFALSTHEAEAGNIVHVTGNITTSSDVTYVSFMFELGDSSHPWGIGDSFPSGTPSGAFDASRFIDGSIQPGSYVLYEIFTMDSAGDRRGDFTNVTAPDGSPIRLNITSPDDGQPPELTSISVAQAHVSRGDTQTVSVSLSDDTGASFVQLSFAAGNGPAYTFSASWSPPAANGTYDLSRTIDDWADGHYVLRDAYVTDAYGNGRDIAGSAFPNASFDVGNASAPGAPDLAAAIVTPPPHLAAGAQSLAWTVYNNGSASSGPFRVQLSLDGILVAEHTIADISAGGAFGTADAWNATEGDHTFTLVADPDQATNDTDRANNVASLVVHVESGNTSGAPDLVAALTTPPPHMHAGAAWIGWAVYNNGTAPSGDFEATLYVDGAPLTATFIGSLGPGSAFSFSNAWDATPGNHTAMLVADSEYRTLDSDRSNNVAVMTISVESDPNARPDLTIAWVDAPFDVTAGDTDHFAAHVENVGQGDAPAFDLAFSLDGSLRTFRFVAPLGAGQATDVNVSWTAAGEGFHDITLTADFNGRVNESDESNNAYTRTIYVEPRMIDVGVRIAGIEHEPIKTDAGNEPVDPLGRHFIHLDLSNGDDRAHTICYEVHAESSPSGFQSIGSGCASLSPGETHVTVAWHPVGVGDVVIHAQAFLLNATDTIDPDPSNDVAQAEDFLLVGGIGAGVLLP